MYYAVPLTTHHSPTHIAQLMEAGQTGLTGLTAASRVAMGLRFAHGPVPTQPLTTVGRTAVERERKQSPASSDTVQVRDCLRVCGLSVMSSLSLAVDCLWLEWSPWGDCNRECGGGTQYRTRDKVAEKYGGKACIGEEREAKDCNTHHCPRKCCSLQI